MDCIKSSTGVSFKLSLSFICSGTEMLRILLVIQKSYRILAKGNPLIIKRILANRNPLIIQKSYRI